MSYRTAYELVLALIAVIVLWLLILKPLYRAVFRRNTMAVTPEEQLEDAQQSLADEQTLLESANINQKAEGIRAKRKGATS